MNERISALIDGEISAAEGECVIDALLESREAAVVWERYQLIGAVLRNEFESDPGEFVAVDVVDRVHAELAGEPTVLAPGSGRKHAAGGGGSPRRGKSWLAAGALALAASVAALAVFTFRPDATGPREGLPVVDGGDPAALVASAAPPAGSAGGMGDEMMELLVGHGEFSPAACLNGLVAYAKFVTGDGGN